MKYVGGLTFVLEELML